MPSKHRANGSAPTRGLRPWRLGVIRRRTRAQWRLLSLVTVVALLSTTLVTTLAIYVSATELGAVRGSFRELPADQRTTSVFLLEPTKSLEVTRTDVDDAVASVLGPGFETTSTALAYSEQLDWRRPHQIPAIMYFGELDGVEQQTVLRSGSWPEVNLVDGRVPVAIPANGAKALGLKLGSELELGKPDGTPYKVVIVGLYDIRSAESPYWKLDYSAGAGHNPSFVYPGSQGFLLTDGVGPLIAAPGAMDAATVPVDHVQYQVSADGTAVTMDDLLPLASRLSSAAVDIPAQLGSAADKASAGSPLYSVTQRIVTGLTITRSTVVIVSLLLLVVAIFTLSQASRLLTEARIGERHLMVARGASRRQLIGLAVGEALFVGLVAMLLAPLLAMAANRGLAMQPIFSAAGMDTQAGLPPVAWVVSGLVALVLVVVLVAPMLGRIGTLQEGEQANARQSRSNAVQRFGIDIAIAALAVVAFWQLSSYRSPVGDALAMTLDPLIVAAPALALLGGALLLVRLVPLASRWAEYLGARARGAAVALAAWEVARRPQRATAAVLLVTLALAVSTFSQAYLASWHQSQIDQAEFAVGAPVRVYTEQLGHVATDDDFPAGYTGDPQPVIRGAAVVDGIEDTSVSSATGAETTLLGLTAGARDMLARGRTGDEAGREIANRVPPSSDDTVNVPLPDETTGISATVVLTSKDVLPGVFVDVSALIKDEFGAIRSLRLGAFPADGEEHSISGTLDGEAISGEEFVGFQSILYLPTEFGESKGNVFTQAELRVKDVKALVVTPKGKTQLTTPLKFNRDDEWRGAGNMQFGAAQVTALTRDGWQLALVFDVPPALREVPLHVALVGWKPTSSIDVAITGDLAKKLEVEVGNHLLFDIEGATVLGTIVAVEDELPGTVGSGTFNALGIEGSNADDGTTAVIMDEVALNRLRIQVGLKPEPITEWWLDVPTGEGTGYAEHANAADTGLRAVSAEALGVELQQHPIRVATIGALQLVALAAALLAAIGFAIHATGSIRARTAEFAQLRAVGLARGRLVGVVATESVLLTTLGAALGIGLGAVLATLVVPLLGISADGSTSMPPVEVIVPWFTVSLLAAELALVLALIVAAVAGLQRGIDPASVLRSGDAR